MSSAFTARGLVTSTAVTTTLGIAPAIAVTSLLGLDERYAGRAKVVRVQSVGREPVKDAHTCWRYALTRVNWQTSV